jgi:diphthamide biosynthesis protein 2
MLMRRYAIVEKAKDADVIGILVGTLGVCTPISLSYPGGKADA